jgi:hypothetical protein
MNRYKEFYFILENLLAYWIRQTKTAYVAHVANHNLPPGQVASYPVQLEVKRRFESGECLVPCYALRCTGFNKDLYHALLSAATRLAAYAFPLSVPTSAIPAPRKTDQTHLKRRAESTENIGPVAAAKKDTEPEKGARKRARTTLGPLVDGGNTV